MFWLRNKKTNFSYSLLSRYLILYMADKGPFDTFNKSRPFTQNKFVCFNSSGIKFLFGSGFTSQSTAMVMLGRSVHSTTFFPGQA